MTAKEFLRWIEKQLFNNGNLKNIPALDAASRHELMLEEADRLLSSSQGSYEATWLSDQFWTADRDLYLIVKIHPILADAYTLDSQENLELTDDDYARAQWLTETALLCHQLYTHANFDTDMLQEGLHLQACDAKDNPKQGLPDKPSAAKDNPKQGLPDKPCATKDVPKQGLLGKPNADDFQYANQHLIDWIRTTRYRRIASFVTAIIIDRELNKATKTNEAVQDYYAYNCSSRFVNMTSVEDCNEHIQKSLDAMERMRQHYEKGVALGLTDEEIRVADALWEFVPHNYDADLVKCARAFCKQAEKLLPDKPYIKSEKGAHLYQQKVMPKLRKTAERWQMNFDDNDAGSLAANYTACWLYDKYYAQ